MRMPPVISALVVLLALFGLTGCRHAPPPTPQQKTAHAPPPQSPQTPAPSAPAQLPALPGITFHLDAGYLELDAQVIGNGTDWLELAACTPGSREHEALVTVTAKPSDLHFALLALDIEPGRTQRGVRTDAGLTLIPATGAPVFLDFILPPPDHNTPPTIIPVGAWVIDRATGQPLNDRTWMFTGSQLIDDQGTPLYLADVNGTVASLVHFGDETLGRDTTLTQDADGQNLAAHPTALPPNGTRLRLRITPAPPKRP